MGGAPSRETLVRYIVRDPRVGCVADDASGGASSMGDASAATSQQPEIVLLPLIPDYFPSSASPLFQQLVQVRHEPTVSYYYRDARSMATEHTVVHNDVGSDKELYSWYMSLSEQRLMETDNELIALSRAGRVVSPVPCAAAFVYNANATPAASATTAAAAATAVSSEDTSHAASSSDGAASVSGNARKKDGGKSNKQHRRGGKGSAACPSNGYMTIENTVRVPHHNLRVRIFGFVGDTRFCPPSMLPSQAAKTPMCLTIFLSKSAGGNHRAQVTLLAAHTYMQQLRHIGVLRHVDCTTATAAVTATGDASGSNSIGSGLSKTASVPGSLAAVSTDDADLLAGLRGAGIGSQAHFADAADPYRDPYADPYAVEAFADPYAVDGYSEQQQPQSFAGLPSRGGGPNTQLNGLGSTSPSSAPEVAKEIVLRRPVEVIVHRADVPALCYVRELRARMDQEELTSLGMPAAATAAEAQVAGHVDDDGEQKGAVAVSKSRGFNFHEGCQRSLKPGLGGAAAENATAVAPRQPQLHGGEHGDDISNEHSLKRLIRTVIKEEELRGSIDAESMGRVLLWASHFYLTHFEQLIGGEAAKLRQELAQRNLRENQLDGTLSLTEDEPRPPKALPVPGDVWITPHDTYVEVRGQQNDTTHSNNAADENGRSDGHGGHRCAHHEMENWKMVSAGTVLRYAASITGCGGWRVSTNEFAEDILLSLCRHACHAARRAQPTDAHWLMNGETGLPEGLVAGLLIWREPAAGQIVYYGTTPDFLKQWMQSGVAVEAAYRNQAEKASAGNRAGMLLSAKRTGEEAASSAAGASGTAGSGNAGATETRHSTSITVATASSTAAATSASKGFHNSYDANSPANNSGVSSGPRGGGSSRERGKGSGSSSMALYSVHTGFVCTPDQDAERPLGPKSGTSSPVENGLASCTTERSCGGSSSEVQRRKARGVRMESSTSAAAPTTTSVAVTASGGDAIQASTPVARTFTSLSGPAGRYNNARLSRSLPAHQRSCFAVPVASSHSLVRTPSSAASTGSSRSNSFHNLGYVDQLGLLSGNSSAYPHAQQADQATLMNLASTCWIGVPDPTSRDGSNTPSVNVVVKQRRSVRFTPGTSLVDGASVPGSTSFRYTPTQGGTGGGYTRMQSYGDVASAAYAADVLQPITVGSMANASVGGAGGAPTGDAGTLMRGSLPIHIFGSRASISEDGSLRQGGHSPSSQERSRSLLRSGDALISYAATTRVDPLTRPPPCQSAAMDVCAAPGANYAGTPVDSSLSLKWTTSSVPQPASMRGASVTYASGSFARHGSLLHSSCYQEPYQPVMSRPASLATSELLALSASSTESFARKKDAVRPPPLFPDAVRDDHAFEEKSSNSSMTPQKGTGSEAMPRSSAAPGSRAGQHVVCSVPVVAVSSCEAARSENSSATHTPRQENVSDGAKSSVGTGKYRWDWRGALWNSSA
jgi:hypothetical protein